MAVQDVAAADPLPSSPDEVEDDYHPTTVLLFTVLILLLTFLSYYLEKTKNPWVTESGAAMIMGLVLGGILKAVSSTRLKKASFTDNFFFDILLPPIILEAGYSLEKRKFFKNLGTILSLAIIGTVIATFVSGWMFSKMYKKLGDSECFVYAALISAVDPVATLSVFKKVNAPEMLFNVVFGESVLNDAVAIIIYQIFLGISASGSGLTAGNLAMALVKLVGIGIGSMLMAAAVSLTTSFALKKVGACCSECRAECCSECRAKCCSECRAQCCSECRAECCSECRAECCSEHVDLSAVVSAGLSAVVSAGLGAAVSAGLSAAVSM
jgi:hypothetical protein